MILVEIFTQNSSDRVNVICVQHLYLLTFPSTIWEWKVIEGPAQALSRTFHQEAPVYLERFVYPTEENVCKKQLQYARVWIRNAALVLPTDFTVWC